MSNKCPICGNATELGVCAVCGYEISSDFIAYPTFQASIESGKRLRAACKRRLDDHNDAALKQKETVEAAKLTDEEQYQKGREYFNGTGSVPRDYQKAFYWCQKAAVNNHTGAQCQMGAMYYYGEGVEKNPKMAFYWFEKAAKQGRAEAQRKLGVYYESGYGVEQNMQTAVYWYKQAAKQGHAEAQCDLGMCYKYGKGVAKDLQMSAYWYEQAAKQGNTEAQYALERL